ncbi:DNA damage-inducible protein 1 [Yarrowia sp. C11]|nr:DNA damage-inducible protein 1 [Yarrowia sp. E02]KAG5373043.1 DNA damage-inducible protein 1 [Yarrowia sp. C11]
MQIFVTTPNENVFGLEVAPDMAYEDLLAFVEMEASVPSKDIILSLNGNPIVDTDPKAAIGSLGVVDNSMLLLTTKRVAPNPSSSTQSAIPTLDFSSIQIPGMPAAPRVDPRAEQIRKQILERQDSLDQLKMSNPELAEHVHDSQKFSDAFAKLQNELRAKEVERKKELQRLYADPDNEDNQKRIMEIIRQENVEESYQNAMEHHPEMFIRTDMLYIDCRINGHDVKAFVDTGAQMTILSEEFCEKVGLTHMLDVKFAGVARGVGSGKILGRVHSVPLQIGSSFFPASVSVIEGNQLKFILGLDMLKRFKANVNLRTNQLEIGEEKASFLGEKDLPDEFGKLGEEQEPKQGSGGAGSSGESFKDEDIVNLMSLGHSREKVVIALKQTDGDVELAASLLFSQ